MSKGAYDALEAQLDGLEAGERFARTSKPAVGVETAPVAVDQEGLERYKRMFSHAREHSLEMRTLNQVAEDYYHNKQWTSEEIAVLQKRKQPQIWINRIAPAVNGILGVIEQGASDPRAFPRNTDDNNAAEIATDSLRFAADKGDWESVKLAAAQDYLIAGTAVCLNEVDESGDVQPTHVPWDEFFWDPHSRRRDFSDARYMGIAKWIYADQLARRYPDANIDTSANGDARALSVGEGLDEDKPTTAQGATRWGDGKTNRLLVVEMYHQEGGWKHCVFYGGGVLALEDSPYQDENGNPSNPIEAQSAYVDRERQRYGIVRAMIPVQDEINMRRSKALHEANSRQIRITDEGGPMMGEIEDARAEAARPDGVLPFGVDVVPRGDVAAQQYQLLVEAKSEIERQGPNPETLGKQNASASGRAHLIRQQAGLTELTPVLGGLERWEKRCYEQFWSRIRQFWNEPKLVRVTDDIGAPKFLTVNEPIMGQPQVVQGPEGPMIQPTVAGYKNRPSEIEVDIIIDSTPDSATVQQEQFAELVKLAGVYGPQEVPFEDLLEASSLPKKRQLIEKRQARQQQQAQGQQPNPMQMAAMEAEMANKAADTELKQANAFKAFTAAETQKAGSMIDAYRAGFETSLPAAGV